MLTEVQRGALLRIARESIRAHLAGADPAPPRHEPLPEASGVFVTIKRHGELRGCLGVLQMRDSLAREVARCAGDAATADPRFPPMVPGELPEAVLEISVLGPLEEIDPAGADAIVVGRHGLVVEHRDRRGLLLPQVAVEWGWTTEVFLGHTCRKAGLSEDAWRRGARVFRFDAEVFAEQGDGVKRSLYGKWQMEDDREPK